MKWIDINNHLPLFGFCLTVISVFITAFLITRHSSKKTKTLTFSILILAASFLIVFGKNTMYGRLIRWGLPGVSQYKVMPYNTIPRSRNPVSLIHRGNAIFADPGKTVFRNNRYHIKMKNLESFLSENQTLALIVVKDGAIVMEKYANGMKPGDISKCFSITKPIVSILIGIALQEGHIKSLKDPVSAYVPELRGRKHANITIEHLLNMTSGIRFRKSEGLNPCTEDVWQYYTPNRYELIMNSELDEEPGTRWKYNDYGVHLLGLVLERATKKKVHEYLSEKIWNPLGMEHDARWTVDSNDNNFANFASGLAAAPRDLLKIGLLFLKKGNWEGTQVVPADWIRKSTALACGDNPVLHTADPGWGPYWNCAYKYLWWIPRGEEYERAYAGNGMLGQYLYVSPKRNIVIIRMGQGWGEFGPWLHFLMNLSRVANGEEIINGPD